MFVFSIILNNAEPVSPKVGLPNRSEEIHRVEYSFRELISNFINPPWLFKLHDIGFKGLKEGFSTPHITEGEVSMRDRDIHQASSFNVDDGNFISMVSCGWQYGEVTLISMQFMALVDPKLDAV